MSVQNLLQFAVVQRDATAATGKDEHPGGDQLVSDMSGRAASIERIRQPS
jgi:hypothetical protein